MSDFAVLFTLISANGKTGPIPVTTTAMNSCPNACEFNSRAKLPADATTNRLTALRGGCYAELGSVSWLWNNFTNAGPNAEFKNGRATMHCDELARPVLQRFRTAD